MRPSSDPKPLVSIVVTTYKHEKYLDQCISSLTEQLASFDYEIIVGNDCSPDATAEILEKHAANFPHKIRVFNHPQNLGMHENLFFCLRMASGEYIALCEGDDFWNDRNKLSKQILILEADDSVELVCSNYTRLHQTSGMLTRGDPDEEDREFDSNTLPRALLLRQFSITTPTIVFRRNSLERAISRNPQFFSKEWPILDLQIFMELAMVGRVVYLSDQLATYRVLPISASRRENIQHAFQDHLAVTRLFSEYSRRLNLSAADVFAIKSSQFQGAINGALTLDHAAGKMMMQSYIDHLSFKPTIKQRMVLWAASHSSSWFCYKFLLSLRKIMSATKHRLGVILRSHKHA